MSKDSMIEFTDAAALRVKTLIEQEGQQYKLRVYITGGGCSGFTYGFTFDDKVNEGDYVVTNFQHNVSMVVDPLTLQYMIGAEVDFVDNLQGKRFVVDNPLVSNVCGCGASFSL